MYDLVALGDGLLDFFIRPEQASLLCPSKKIPGRTCFQPVLCLSYGAKIPVSEAEYQTGGSAANVSVGLSRLGLKTAFLGLLGDDLIGDQVVKTLTQEGVGLRYLHRIKQAQSGFSVVITTEQERTILVYRGLKDYSKLKIPSHLPAKWLYLAPLGHHFERIYQGIIPLVSTQGVKLALNPSNTQLQAKSELKRILRLAQVVFLNKEEAEELVGARQPLLIKELFQEIKKWEPEMIVITDGSNGAYFFDGQEVWSIPAYQTKKREVTGAGDAFATGFLAAYLLNKEKEAWLRWGIVDSASVISQVGAQAGLLNQKKMELLVKKAPFPQPLK